MPKSLWLTDILRGCFAILRSYFYYAINDICMWYLSSLEQKQLN